MHFRNFTSIILLVLVTISSCNKDGNSDLETPGAMAFSFKRVETSSAGRTNTENPAFVSYSAKHTSGSVISDKIELYDFNGEFVTHPIELIPGDYQLVEFLVLADDNSVIYASPLTDSPLAHLVDHPLPLAFTISAEETTEVVPEVIAIDDHEPAEFGYLTFAFNVVEKIGLHVNVYFADQLPHTGIDYSLQVTAKDAPLGQALWTKTFSLAEFDKINIPARYDYYVFSARKNGYIDHVQHYQKSMLADDQMLKFEFIPESLEGFRKKVAGPVTFYYPSDVYRCKLYTRVDVQEGYTLGKISTDRSAVKKGGLPVFGSNFSSECADESTTLQVCGRVNIFFDLPFNAALDYCGSIAPGPNGPINPADIVIKSFTVIHGHEPNDPENDYFFSDFQEWN
jgi:hypothetical protein